MFDDQSFDALTELQMPESLVPHKHSADPFACPCCANVFSETLRLTNTDLSEHAKGLPPGQRQHNAAHSGDQRSHYHHGCESPQCRHHARSGRQNSLGGYASGRARRTQ